MEVAGRRSLGSEHEKPSDLRSGGRGGNDRRGRRHLRPQQHGRRVLGGRRPDDRLHRTGLGRGQHLPGWRAGHLRRRLYQALVTHTAHPGAGWNPAGTPSLWRDLGACSGGDP
ncbi:carbohydrate-binding protein, partial [Micromonospora parastrephiae]|uniref:carbohydrate-binding protein n=1 Tax=Micromonospora parastrephiae TaxID=2806101 RepID=UPI003899560A